MPGFIVESLPRALASINTTAGNQRGQRKRPHTNTCEAPAITSGQFVFSCIHTHFWAVCVGVCAASCWKQLLSSGQQIPSCLLIRAGKCKHVLVGAVKTTSSKERKWGYCVKWLNWRALMQYFNDEGWAVNDLSETMCEGDEIRH